MRTATPNLVIHGLKDAPVGSEAWDRIVAAAHRVDFDAKARKSSERDAADQVEHA